MLNRVEAHLARIRAEEELFQELVLLLQQPEARRVVATAFTEKGRAEILVHTPIQWTVHVDDARGFTEWLAQRRLRARIEWPDELGHLRRCWVAGLRELLRRREDETRDPARTV